MCKIIVVSSGKGGTGKTTTVAAVSSCLAMLGARTLCMDFDIGFNNLDLYLCMSEFAVSDFTDVLEGRMELMDACCESPLIPGLYFLNAPTDKKETENIDVADMFAAVREHFDYCVIDAPPGFNAGFALAHAQADMSIIVTNGELPSIRDAQKTADIIRDMGVADIRLLINRVRPANFKILQTTIDDIIDTIQARLIGIVHEDKHVFRALHEHKPLILYKKRRAAYEFSNVARRIMGEDVPLRKKGKFSS
ncbi:MAG: AAA family ATPase [Oscillospiraceae bacterium]|nr:AAA family ATPase [Oscillospiraceae bacterium]